MLRRSTIRRMFDGNFVRMVFWKKNTVSGIVIHKHRAVAVTRRIRHSLEERLYCRDPLDSHCDILRDFFFQRSHHKSTMDAT